MINVDFDKGVMNFGDVQRLKKAMLKARSGKPVTVGFIGGSITQGCLSSVPETCYAYLVYEWWQKKFTDSYVNYINAGIGATPSDFGVARVDEDLLKYEPDFVIVEFSVNDGNTFHYMETYEGLIRHILKSNEDRALMLVHNVKYDDMSSAEDKHLIVGKYYNLPSVSMKHSVYPLVANKTIGSRDITKDDLHPNDDGHMLLARLVTNYLDKVYENLESDSECENLLLNKEEGSGKDLPKPLTSNGYENSKRLNNRNYEPECSGFERDDTVQNHITEIFRYGYTAWNEGSSIKFTADCSSIAVQYRKSVNKPAPIAIAIVDGDEDNAEVLDANFDEDWGDCLYTHLVADHIDKKEHTIEIRIIKDHSRDEIKDVVPFYLVSVIVS